MTDKPKKLEGVTLTEADDESILYDSIKGQIHILNPTGAKIWDLCDGNNTLEDIAKNICVQFETDDFESVSKDVEEYLAELKKLELIESAV